MKNLLLLVIGTLMSLQLSAQEKASIFKLEKIIYSIGGDRDGSNNFGPDQLLSQIGNDPEFPLQGIAFTNDAISKNDINFSLKLGMSLAIPKYERLELTNYVFWVPGKYTSFAFADFPTFEPMASYLSIGIESHEIGLETIIAYKLIDKKRLKFYSGLGSNAGANILSKIYVEGENITEIKSVNTDQISSNADLEFVQFRSNDNFNINHRFFVQVGGTVVLFKGIEFGLDLRQGFGLKYQSGATTKNLKYTSAGVTIKFQV